MSTALAIAGVQALSGLVGGWFSNNAAKKQAEAVQNAANEESGTLNGLAQPYNEAGKMSIPMLLAQLQQQFGVLGKDNPYLSAEHNANLANISRGKSRALASANILGATSPSAKRGMTLAAEQAATGQANQENIGYGLNQQNWQQTALQNFMQTLGEGLNLGQYGTGLSANAAQVKANGAMTGAGIRQQGTQDMLGDIMGGLGSGLGTYWGAQEQDKLTSALGKVKAGGGGTGIVPSDGSTLLELLKNFGTSSGLSGDAYSSRWPKPTKIG